MTALAALVAAALVAGALLMFDALRPSDAGASTTSLSRTTRIPRDRALRAGLAASAVLVMTRWPIAAIAAATAGWFFPELTGSRTSRDRALQRTEAISSWTEMLRDTMSAAHGLEAAIVTTAPLAPEPIRDEIRRLQATLRTAPLIEALRSLALDLAHPIGDLVVASLSVAATGSVRDLGELLGTLAEAARDEAAMQMRVEASRARMRTAVRVIGTVTVAMAAGLVLLNPQYVAIYRSAEGQAVLAGVLACWGIALWWLASMSHFKEPDRFLVGAGVNR